MPNKFYAHIDQSISNPGLQAALDDNYTRRLNVRLESYTSLPEDVETMRQRAHAVRSTTIANLETYLQQFIQEVSANGITVHRAADASQAVEIVLEIARKNGVRLVAKAKTMVGEEIGVNEALEKAGIEVVETDLGEYIVQIRGERPAHIITPAVHLRRSDVGQTFHEKLGIPYTDDITTLTTAARDRLRQVFLNADMGISGVNLGVAETGDLVLLTNEGNGRLVCTLPLIHVALMGVERLVPNMDDLATILYLLPRSATGQKLTVYTNLMRTPRLPDDPDGPQERHLVLVDNGRSALIDSPLQESLMCIRCGACLNICPAFREMGGHAYVSLQGQPTPYTGPIGSVISPALFGYHDFGHLARACSLCGACKEACPVDINLPEMLLRVRSGKMPDNMPGARSAEKPVKAPGSSSNPLSQQVYPPNAPPYLKFGLSAFTWIATSTTRFRAAQRMAGFFSRLLSPRTGWLHLPAFTGWGFSKDFPRPAVRPFSARWVASQAARRATRQASAPAHLPQTSDIPDLMETAPHDSLHPEPSLTEWFGKELTRIGGTFIPCTLADLTEQVLNVVRQEGLSTLQAWEEDQLPSGILLALRAAGITIVHNSDPSHAGGLTGALAGIAESGSLVLTAGPGRPLTASLLPRIHLAVLRASAITDRLPQALHLPGIREASSAVLISGPSRTADIEMTMTIGMHGPGKLYVFCIQDQG